jgi:hypothetical protein
MLRKTSLDFRKFFLLAFTRELIRNSGPSEVLELKNVLENKEEQGFQGANEKEKLISSIKKKIKQEENIAKTGIEDSPKFFASLSPAKNQHVKPRISHAPVMIPRQELPPQLQYIKPVLGNTEIDLGKLNSLVKDPLTRSIECRGADSPIYVTGNMGNKKTGIVLSKDEIDEIINKFSEASKIPLGEGVFRVAIGKLVFSAIVSDVVSSKFIIKKLLYPSSPGYRRF